MKLIFTALIVLQIFVQIHMSENIIKQVEFRQKIVLYTKYYEKNYNFVTNSVYKA